MGYNPLPPAERAEYCGEIMDFRMVDLVQIPENLPLGEYVLSFRWDCEQTPQIWTQCANVKITATESPSPSPALPGGGCCKFGPVTVAPMAEAGATCLLPTAQHAQASST